MLSIVQIQDIISLNVSWPTYEVKETWPRNCCCFANSSNYFLARPQSRGCKFQISPTGESLNITLILRRVPAGTDI